MFFNIGPTRLDNFPKNYQHNNLYINLDAGWHESQDQHGNILFYKGYVDSAKIEDVLLEIAEQEEPIFYGNFCLIKCFDQGVAIKADQLRSFPIWYDTDYGLNNLIPYNYTCWTDSFVTLTHSLEKIESKFDLIGPIESTTLSYEVVIEQVDQILTDKITKFAQTLTQPIRVFLSGGIDTTTLFSYIRRLEIPYELVDCLHTNLDYFYLKNHGDLANFWGYRQFHYWKHPSVLLSGTPGDEFTVRSPTTANMMLRYYGTDINELSITHSSSLHYQYFKKYTEIFESQQDISFNSLDHAIRECLNIIINDWQHWHLGATISYTPLRDLEIFKTIARLEKSVLIEQIMDSVVQKELIRRNNPELLSILSADKNNNNYFENLTRILT
jgi:hypothetical protein